VIPAKPPAHHRQASPAQRQGFQRRGCLYVGGALAALVAFAQTAAYAQAAEQAFPGSLPSPDAGSADALSPSTPPRAPDGPAAPSSAATPDPLATASLPDKSLPAPDAEAEGPSAPQNSSKLKEVVVTAQRREESAQQVPIAVSVLSGESLEDTGVGRSAGQVLDYVPNASAATQLHSRPRWWIRGVGTGQQALDFANPVGFYLDDVYISNASATGFPLFDLDRVEVLRGPQGTLWGKNTTGGAVDVISRQPTFGPNEGDSKFDYGTFNDKLLEAAQNGVIWSNRLAARASFHYESRDGRFDDQYDGGNTGAFQDVAARLQLLGKIADDLTILGNVHVRQYGSSGDVATVVGTGPGGAYLSGYVPSTGINDVNANAPNNSNIGQTGANLTLKWQLGTVAMTAISGYEEYHELTLADGDNTPLEVSRTYLAAVSRQYSEEIRLASPRSDRWNWVAGLFAFHEDIKENSASARLPGVDTLVGPPNYALTAFDHKNSSFAPFASTTFNFTDALSLKGGVRWTVEERDLAIDRVANGPGNLGFSDISNWWNPASVSSPLIQIFQANPSHTWTNFTYDLTPAFAITPEASVYFRFAHGVKSGGFNTAATTLSALNVVQPEQLNDYEIGTKTSWFGKRLIANADGFYYDYRDIQVNVVGPLPPTNTAVSYIQNAQAARVFGGEFELEALPVRYLHLAGDLGLLNAKFTDFKALYGGENYTGNHLVRSPTVSSLLRADVTLPLQIPFRLSLGGDWHFTSRQFFYTTGQTDPLLQQNAYSLINGRITLQSRDEKVSLVLYANNLLDVRYKNHALPGAAGATGDTVYWADPRTVGASLICRWW